MLLTLIAAVSLGSMPVEIDRQFWFDTSRLPATKKPYYGEVALTVDATGRAVACRLVVASGVRRLDAMICTMPLKSAVFHPAVDPQGRAVAAVVERGFAVNMASPPPPPAPPVDFAVPISRMPETATTPFVTLRMVTDSSGRVSDCLIVKSTGNRLLDQLACPAARTIDLPKIANSAGVTLRAMRDVSVGFTVEPSIAAPL